MGLALLVLRFTLPPLIICVSVQHEYNYNSEEKSQVSGNYSLPLSSINFSIINRTWISPVLNPVRCNEIATAKSWGIISYMNFR
jgi:hypothetical protein